MNYHAELKMFTFSPHQNVRLGHRTQRTRSKNDATHCDWDLEQTQERLHMTTLDEDTGVFFMATHMWRHIADKLRGSEGSICSLASVAPLVTARHSFSIPHPGSSILYLRSSTCLGHFLPTATPHSLPLLDVCSLCPCKHFQSCLRTYLFQGNSAQK